MKKIITILIFAASISNICAQNINWKSMNESQRHLTYLNFGYNFGTTTQFGYGLRLDGFKPILLNVDYSFPMGKDLFDDFKVRIGGQISILEKSNFIVSAKVCGIFRRHQTKLVRMANFGSELSALIGYYRPKWHFAGEFGFDKSIITHLKHSDIIRENLPHILNGWFIPSGGYFFYGVQGSKTIGNRFEISLRMGATNAQFKDVNALLPMYAQLELIYKLSSIREVNFSIY